MSKSPAEFVASFREASPYINAHRERTVVLNLGGTAIASPRLLSLVHDIALLNTLGLRLVVVHGTRPQVEARLRERGIDARYVAGVRVTDPPAMACVKDAAGAVRIELEAAFSQGLANSPMAGAELRVASGNFVIARPIGVRDGVDFGLTGTVRRLDTDAMKRRLDAGELVLLSPLGYSPTGEAFNLSAAEVATAVAAELAAAKLVFLMDLSGMPRPGGQPLRQLTHGELPQLIHENPQLAPRLVRILHFAGQACRQGVQRVHLLPLEVDGALLLELFTRDGIGTMVSSSPFDSLRPASIDDVGGIVELIAPLEHEGTLVRRSREKLEMDIGHFTVIERDGTVIACAALLPYPEVGAGELAALAVHPEYRNAGKAASLCEYLEARARQIGLQEIFVLTTQAEHWFIEQGFRAVTPAELPVARQALYNYQRNSKVLKKTL